MMDRFPHTLFSLLVIPCFLTLRVSAEGGPSPSGEAVFVAEASEAADAESEESTKKKKETTDETKAKDEDPSGGALKVKRPVEGVEKRKRSSGGEAGAEASSGEGFWYQLGGALGEAFAESIADSLFSDPVVWGKMIDGFSMYVAPYIGPVCLVRGSIRGDEGLVQLGVYLITWAIIYRTFYYIFSWLDIRSYASAAHGKHAGNDVGVCLPAFAVRRDSIGIGVVSIF